jgi:chaperonin cofactor prefoldin
MAFNWKSLFIVDEEAEKATKFGNNQPLRPTESAPATSSSDKASISQSSSGKIATNGEVTQDVLAVYEKGFDSLNHEGYDFFELYKSVMAVGADNPQSYQMAFVMGKSIKADLTKSFLLEKAKVYVAEIEKVHAKYAEVGNKKKADLAQQLNSEKNNLNNSIKSLESQIASLQAELNKAKGELAIIDNKFGPTLAEMEARIIANDHAKQTLLSSIQKVINGINQNL